jgi:hypothetical protein
MTTRTEPTPVVRGEQSTPPACPACGHRLALHGFLMRDAWCIAWDGSTFCGCQVCS